MKCSSSVLVPYQKDVRCFNSAWFVDAHNAQIRIIDLKSFSLRIITTVKYIVRSIAITDNNHIVASCRFEIAVFDAETAIRLRTINLPETFSKWTRVKTHGYGFFVFNRKNFWLFQVLNVITKLQT
jgi:hypothetical protein